MSVSRIILLTALAAGPLFGQGDPLAALLEGGSFARVQPADGKGPAPKNLLLTAADIIIPQIASSGNRVNGGFSTFLDVVNISPTTTWFTISFFDGNGNPIEMPLTATNPDGSPCQECPPVFASSFEDRLTPGQSLQQVIQPGGATRIGWAGVFTEADVAVGVTATFVQIVPGRPLFMTGIPPTTALQQRAWMSVSDTGGLTSSMALVNSDPDVAQILTLIYRNGDGEELCRTTAPLGPFGHTAFLIRDRLPCAQGRRGAVEVSAPSFFAGIGIWAHDSGGFVTQPLLEIAPGQL